MSVEPRSYGDETEMSPLSSHNGNGNIINFTDTPKYIAYKRRPKQNDSYGYSNFINVSSPRRLQQTNAAQTF